MLSQAVTRLLPAGDLLWDAEGYYPFGDASWKENIIKTRFTYKSGSIGLMPHMQSGEAYILFAVGNFDSMQSGVETPQVSTAIADAYAQIFGEKVFLGKKEIAPLLADQEYNMAVQITRSNYKFYFNGELIFNIDFSSISQGMPALYATADNSCSMIEVIGSLPNGWTTNLATLDMATVEIRKELNQDQYIYMENPYAANPLTITQPVNLEFERDYTLSFSYRGSVKCEVIERNGSSPKQQILQFSSIDWTRGFMNYHASNDCSMVDVTFSVETVDGLSINNIFFEPNAHMTDYIHNDYLDQPAIREKSYITYPSNENIDLVQGALNVWLKPEIDYTKAGTNGTILEHALAGDILRIGYVNGKLLYQYARRSYQAENPIKSGEWHMLTVNWSELGPELYVDGMRLTLSAGPDIGDQVRTFDTLIHIGHSQGAEYGVYNGLMDDLMIFSRPLPEDTVLDFAKAMSRPESTSQMLLRASFDHEIVNNERSIIEVSPAPQYGSPIVVKNEMDTILNKVSYFDEETGEYRPYNIEEVQYSKKLDFITIGCKDVETEKFVTQVKDAQGDLIGDPYVIKGERIYLTLTNAQKKELHNSTLYVTYAPKNPYTVDFNIGMVDSFRVNLGKHDGQSVNITYEGNRFSNEKLLDMVEMNPMLNPNHHGFLYITQNAQDVASFRVSISPNEMAADGVTESIVCIEPVDALGNFISNVSLDVTATEGSMIPCLDPGSIKMRAIAGRFLYKYRAPLIKLGERDSSEITDYINIRDKKSGLGVQSQITLNLFSSYDVDYTIPLDQQTWESLASYILDKVMDYFGKKADTLPNGLGKILDLNNDGMINLQEIIWLNDNKLSSTLYDKYVEVMEWYRIH